ERIAKVGVIRDGLHERGEVLGVLAEAGLHLEEGPCVEGLAVRLEQLGEGTCEAALGQQFGGFGWVEGARLVNRKNREVRRHPTDDELGKVGGGARFLKAQTADVREAQGRLG